MPGLCAVIDFGGNSAAPSTGTDAGALLLDRMVASLRHQEQHTERFRYDSPFIHLATVGYDSPGQTVSLGESNDGAAELWLGEFYDSRDIRTAMGPGDMPAAWRPAPDTTRIPRFYRIEQPTPAGTRGLGDFLSRVSGSFIGVRFSPITGEFTLFNDVIASFPLCLRRYGRWLLVAPEIKGVIEPVADGLVGELSTVGFFLLSGYLPPGRTWFKGVDKLMPATLVSGTANQKSGVPPEVRVSSYWDFHVDPTRLSRDGEQALSRRLAGLIEETVASQIRPGEKTALLLSGGYDSRGLLGAALHTKQSVATVTWGHDEHLPGSDAVVARDLSRAAGLRHHFFPLRVEPIEDNAARWVWMTDGSIDGLYNYPEGDVVFRRLGDQFDVIIRGDECFGMRWPYPIANDAVARTCIALHPLRWHSIYEDILRADAYRALCDASDRAIDDISALVVARHPVDRKEEYYLKVRFQCYLNVLNYFKLQSVHLRNPLLDRRVLEMALTVPRPLRNSKRLYKVAVTRHLAPFPDIPFASRTSLVPWQSVVAASPSLSKFFRANILETSGLFERLIDRDRTNHQLDRWLSLGADHGPSAVDVRPPRFGRLKSLGRHLAYHPLTPEPLRRAILPSRSLRRPFHYAFRLLVLALYIGELNRRGIAPDWE